MRRAKTPAELGLKGFLPDAEDALARRLRTWREERGIPLREIARKLRVTTSCVSSWETGARFPTATRLDQLARLMRSPSCGAIFYGEGECPLCRRARVRHGLL
jgi:transcriptional regulator with XRE-family HTH domain